ncbi:unnamed protein product, partial [Polarella glacialis]
VMLGVTLTLASVQNVYAVRYTNVWDMVTSVVIVLSSLKIMLRAAAVTDSCKRVPAVLNSLDFGQGIDRDQLYLVQYIHASDAGLYAFESRVDTNMVMRFLYFTGIASIGIANQEM